MQSKGSLGSVVAGVIAIFMVLICLFYLSFTLVTNHYEKKAEEYATVEAAKDNNSPETKRKAYSEYIKNIANEKVYLGYTFNEVQKLGVGLGLDLKGGMNVTLQVSVPDILRSMANAEGNPYFERAVESADSITRANKSNDFIDVFCDEYRKLDPQGDLSVVFKDQVKRGDNLGAIKNSLRQEVKDRVSSSTNVLRTRIDQFGVVAPNIQELEKDGQILLELPGVKEHDRVRDLLKASANLEFYEVYTLDEIYSQLMALENALRTDSVGSFHTLFGYFDGQGYNGTPYVGMATQAHREKIDSIIHSPMAARILPSNLKLLWEVKPQEVQYTDTVTNTTRKVDIYQLVALRTNNGKPALAGDVVVAAGSDFETMKGNYVTMTMTNEGAKAWARVTQNNIGKPVAIVLDDAVYSAPRINSVIEGGRSEITGNFTVDDAKDLANVLKSGKMAAKVEIVSDTVIGPSLGKQAIQDGFLSFIIALVLLMIFMMAFYGFIPGLIANMGLVCNLFFTMGILASFQAVLTLSGIAGIVLALGMAVDANVLIYERAKEELRAGKGVRTAIADGYSNAFSAIFDSNLTSIITGIILFYFGTGPIRGFATTLIIGILCSFFTAVFLTRVVYEHFMNKDKWLGLTFTTGISKNLMQNVHYNFMGMMKRSFTVFGIIIVACVVSFVLRGLAQSIDFTGGRNFVVQFEQQVEPETVRDLLKQKITEDNVQAIALGTDKKTIRITTNYRITEDSPTIDSEIEEFLYQSLKDGNLLGEGTTLEIFIDRDNRAGGSIISSQKVGPSIADDIKTSAIWSVLLALVAIGLYILLRFRNVAYSVGATVALAVDTTLIIGAYSLCYGWVPFSLEIDQTFIGAILTAIGYSINDKVVIFDRIREFFGLYPKRNRMQLFNDSLNTTLARTINTSLSTLIVLLCIFVLGGDSIRSFAFAMILGVVIGTLTSLFIAAPVAYLTLGHKMPEEEKKA